MVYNHVSTSKHSQRSFVGADRKKKDMQATETIIATPTAAVGATVWLTDDVYNTRTVIADRWQAYGLAAGEMLVESHNGYITIGVWTGNTRKFWGVDCPTIARFEVDTFADIDGVLMGRKGVRIAGTSAIRPELVA